MRYLKIWGPTIVWMLFIFFLSSRTSVRVSDQQIIQFLFFKTLHLIEYSLLYILLYRSLRLGTKRPSWQNRFDAFLIAVMYGISDEIHQKFVPSREGAMRDVYIDTLAITIGAVFIWKLLPRMPKRLKNWAKKLQFI